MRSITPWRALDSFNASWILSPWALPRIGLSKFVFYPSFQAGFSAVASQLTQCVRPTCFELCSHVNEFFAICGILFWWSKVFAAIGLRNFVSLFYRLGTICLLVTALKPLISKDIDSRIGIKRFILPRYRAINCQHVRLIISAMDDAFFGTGPLSNYHEPRQITQVSWHVYYIDMKRLSR